MLRSKQKTTASALVVVVAPETRRSDVGDDEGGGCATDLDGVDATGALGARKEPQREPQRVGITTVTLPGLIGHRGLAGDECARRPE